MKRHRRNPKEPAWVSWIKEDDHKCCWLYGTHASLPSLRHALKSGLIREDNVYISDFDDPYYGYRWVTPIGYAFAYEYHDALQLMLQWGFDPNKPCNERGTMMTTFLSHYFMGGDVDLRVAEMIVNFGASVDPYFCGLRGNVPRACCNCKPCLHKDGVDMGFYESTRTNLEGFVRGRDEALKLNRALSFSTHDTKRYFD